MRLTHKQYEMTASGRIYEREAPTIKEHAITNTMLLRPRGERARTLATDTEDAINQEAEMDTYRIWHPMLMYGTAPLTDIASSRKHVEAACSGLLLTA